MITHPVINAFIPRLSYVSHRTHCQLQLKDSSIEGIAVPVYSYLKSESLSSVLSKSDLLLIIDEVQSNPEVMEDMNSIYGKYWQYIYTSTAKENKSLKEIIGSENCEKLLSTVESVDVYDPKTIRAFLQTPVFESMLGGILYEGIFEFLQKVDIIGSIINRLPIIGPIRQTIVKEFKSSLDKTVGAQIKTFLSAFNKVAVERMADFILSPSNRKSFSKANRNLVDSIVSRPLSSLIPLDEKENQKLQSNIWTAIEKTPIAEVEGFLDYVYDKIGDKKLGDILKLADDSPTTAADAVEKLPDTAKQVMSNNMERFLASPQG